MKISDIKVIPLRYTYENPIGDALSTINARQALLIKIETDSGIYGMGEAFTYGNPLEVTKSIIDKQFSPLLINEDPLNIEWIWNKLFLVQRGTREKRLSHGGNERD
ncbi:hypothetical protein ABK905_20095 [Acerihabitans sp. KWT182]|uniref:Mandelate racemase/muconate lactonizing enzyme N-terminal domain-containing protein n=1 Tax=Acerihabitans sp. KWT182 TaxID=3157919 RepID=A0AAU7Q6S6_9GAMM